MEPQGMDVILELTCRLAVVNRRGGVLKDFSWGSITVGLYKESTPSEEPFIIVRTSPNNVGTRYNLIGNIEGLSTQLLHKGHVTVCLKEPSCNIFITNADPKKLTEYISYFKLLLPADSVMAASEPPNSRISLNLRFQETYKLRMKNIIDMNFNLDHFTQLIICDCTLELAGDQVPIAAAIRRMKNLTIFALESIELCSSTFLEIESKELKQLHLCDCETQLQVSSLFKNDLCYKDSLADLRLEENKWSEIPNGIFEFRNLLQLSLRDNLITELPDKFTNFPKLFELNLSRNQLTHVPPSIFEMQNLLRLSLDSNRITELPNISTISSKLQLLSLRQNQLTHLPPSIFAHPNLSILYLRNNLITELPDMFANLPKLQVLFLSDNKIRDLPPSIFSLQNLMQLYLNGNLIAELPDIINLPKLNTMGLDNNQLRYVPASIFMLQNLSMLDLSGNFITDLPNIISLPKLQTLLLDNNQFSYVPANIFEMQNLYGLSLSGNHITELPDKFTNLSKLKSLSLSRNPLQYLPPSIALLHLRDLDIDYNEFNFENIPPSVGSELIVPSLKELTYRTILKHELIVEEGMLPKRFLKDLANYKECVCGCKFVDGQELVFLHNLSDILSVIYQDDDRDPHLRVPIRGNLCTSLKSCLLDRVTKCRYSQ